MNQRREGPRQPPAAPSGGGRSRTAGRPDRRFSWLAPMVVWPLAQRHLPGPTVRPQGGGTRRSDDEAVFAAVLFVLACETPWRALPRNFGVSWQHAHRRFVQWSDAEVWERLRENARDPRLPEGVRHWAGCLACAAARRHRRTTPAPVPPARAVHVAGRRLPRSATGREGERPAVHHHEGRALPTRLFGRDPDGRVESLLPPP